MSNPLRVTFMLAAVAVLAIASGAQAHRFVATTNVKVIDVSASAVSGKVASAQKFCRRNRQVQLLAKSPGQYDVVATTQTDTSGAWSFTGPFQPAYQDKYKVAATKKKVSPGGHKHNCVADKTEFTLAG